MKFPTYEEMGKEIAEKALDEYLYKGKTLREWVEIISAEEKQTNTAEWITYPYNEVKCSNCDYDLWGNLISAKDEFKYCPNCGSRMKGD